MYDFSTEAEKKLALFADEIYSWNPRYKLLSRTDGADRDRIMERHVLDSLSPVDLVMNTIGALPRGAVLYDLGSGAGLPGIPLAIVLPELMGRPQPVVLVERSGRRTRFLRYITSKLELEGVSVFEGDFVDLNVPAAEQACVVFRALTEISMEFVDALSATFPEGTPVLAYKGRSASVKREAERTGGTIHEPGGAGTPGVVLRFTVSGA